MFAMPRRFALVLIAAAVFAAPFALRAQEAVPPGSGDHFRDTSMLKVPAGARVAIYEFEDLECPACSRAFPIVHAAVEKYKIPLIRHDFPLQQHRWSREAAITARYLQDKVSPETAEQFRRDVFQNQQSIVTPEDLQGFTRQWFTGHHLQMPFVMDPSGRFAAEVEADYSLGERIGLVHTPTVLVLYSKGYIHVTDITQLYSTIDRALAESPVAATSARNNVHGGPKHPATKQN